MVMPHPNPDSAAPISEPVIRRASLADSEAIAAIGAATFVETFGHLYPPSDLERFLAEAYSPERTRADLSDPAKASWIVHAGDQVIGYALAGPCGLPHPRATANCGELKRIYLLKAWHGGGLGARLFAETMAWLQSGGPRSVWIGVWSENHRALSFYARHGFEKVGEYDFHVGDTIDREYILCRGRERFSSLTAESTPAEHNPA
jgi:ribosomal protein S18 acetylase RimI-like enzyme